MTQEPTSIQSLQRAFEILEILSLHPSGITLTDLAGVSGLSKSTVHRFLSSLCSLGYATKDEFHGKYRLTLRMYEIGGRVVHALGILDIAPPIIEQLVEKSQETVHLVLQEGSNVVYILKRNPSTSVINMASGVGNRAPMYCTGVGKAILAYLPLEEIRNIWQSSQIIPYTDTTICTLDELQRELAQVRARGIAFDNEEHEKGISCIAAPIFDYLKHPKYALSVSFPIFRMTPEKRENLIQIVQNAAQKISLILGSRQSSSSENTPVIPIYEE